MTHRIAVVEDDEAFATLLTYNLEASGFTVDWISSGTLAYKTFSKAPYPDLVLLDCGLPGLSGTEVLRRLRWKAETARTPVLMLTGYSDRSNREYAYALGATDFVTKPVILSMLLSRICALVCPLQMRAVSTEPAQMSMS